jgi:glycosyltransferase involved in cell wall biosynthesis
MTKRRFLFIHQNFPGQFGNLARELARLGHEVVALGIHTRDVPGVRCLRYGPKPPARPSDVAAARDFESKVVRGLACAQAMDQLKREGFVPDSIVAHPGWGEALFCKDIWPAVRLLIFAEFYYSTAGTDYAFDPEFTHDDTAARARLRLKNSVLLHALSAADGGYAPTHWQQRQIPPEYRARFDVIFDGIDTGRVAPNPRADVRLGRDGLTLRAGDEVLTFVNRNLEPYRGFHVFMRALPEILRRRPQAHALIIGRDDVSYGSKPADGRSWRQVMLAEVGAALPLDRVHFVGALPYADYLRVLQVSRCHVYLTYPFVLSWSCLEAMSAGCLVVGSRTAPVEEVIEHGANGLLVDFFDVPGWVDQVTTALARPQAHRALTAQARRSVVERYDLRAHCLPRQVALMGVPGPVALAKECPA